MLANAERHRRSRAAEDADKRAARLAADAERHRQRRAEARAQRDGEFDVQHLLNGMYVEAAGVILAPPKLAWQGWPAAPGCTVPIRKMDKAALNDAMARSKIAKLQDERLSYHLDLQKRKSAPRTSTYSEPLQQDAPKKGNSDSEDDTRQPQKTPLEHAVDWANMAGSAVRAAQTASCKGQDARAAGLSRAAVACAAAEAALVRGEMEEMVAAERMLAAAFTSPDITR